MRDMDTKRHRVEAMTKAGMTVREIANALGLSTQGVRYHLNRLGMKPGNK